MNCYNYIVIDPVKTGKKIRALMNAHMLTAEGLASAIGVLESSTINRWCCGKSVPSTRFVLAMMSHFMVKIDEIVSYEVK